MKKTTAVIIFLGVGAVIVFGWIAGRLTHAIDIYTFSSSSNLPTHKSGSLFVASRLKAPDYGCFICYKNSSYHDIWIHRVIGKSNDMIEIKDAVVYRNGEKLNEPYTWNEYILSKEQYKGIAGYIEKNKNDMYELGDSTYKVALTDSEVKKYQLNCKRYIFTATGIVDSSMIAAFRDKGYTVDNFGPVKVPANCYFVLGDDRHNALDSRYMGFIKAEDIVSTKIGN